MSIKTIQVLSSALIPLGVADALKVLESMDKTGGKFQYSESVKYGPCHCGSGKKFKFCCMKKS